MQQQEVNTKEKEVSSETNAIGLGTNSKRKDSSGKLIFGDSILCAQFLRGYVNIPILKDVKPEDIEDVSERYVHLFVEERNSDVVKKVHLKQDEMPFFLLSLIEHKAQVDYNVVMQILRYMVYIWEDYEKEQERLHPGISKTKGFQYPPVLPIIYYEGMANWSASIELQERVFLSDILEEYLPNFKCILVQLKDYSNAELMEHRDELSIIMMISKLQEAAEFAGIEKEISPDYLDAVTASSPEYLLDIMAQIVEFLLRKLNLPFEEAENFAGQIKERHMAELFSNFKGYDVQATRKEAREEARKEDIVKLIEILQELDVPQESILEQIKNKYELSAEEIENFAGQIKERHMAELFSNFKGYDVQATRKKAREEAIEESIGKLIQVMKELNASQEAAIAQLMEKYALSEQEASEKVEKNW